MKRLASCWLKDKEKREKPTVMRRGQMFKSAPAVCRVPVSSFKHFLVLCKSLILQRNKKDKQKKAHYFSLTGRWPAVPGCRWAGRLTASGGNAPKHPNLWFFGNWLIFCEGKCFLVFSWGPRFHRSDENKTQHKKHLSSSTDVSYFKDVHKNKFCSQRFKKIFGISDANLWKCMQNLYFFCSHFTISISNILQSVMVRKHSVDGV